MTFKKELIKIFAKKTGCDIQHGGCPCNSCFHSIDADFKHICWLIILGLRGDYDSDTIIDSIEKELNE
jgi:hypothetical protein